MEGLRNRNFLPLWIIVWELVPCPIDANVVMRKWLYTLKYGEMVQLLDIMLTWFLVTPVKLTVLMIHKYSLQWIS